MAPIETTLQDLKGFSHLLTVRQTFLAFKLRETWCLIKQQYLVDTIPSSHHFTT